MGDHHGDTPLSSGARVTVPADEWASRAAAWEARVQALGVDRAVYHKRHTAAEFPAVTAMQQAAILPHLDAALRPGDDRLLDFGCGYGRWTPILADRVTAAIGVDPTPALLARAEADRQGHPCVSYRPYTAGVIPVEDGSIDVLWCCMVLSTVLDERMFAHTLRELRRVLHVGSLVCLTDNTSTTAGKPVRSPYSISRTIEEYRAAFASWVNLEPVGAYEDFGEINTIFLGRVHG